MQETIKESGIFSRTIFSRDNLEVLRGMDSNTIDLIYLDPPFNKKKVFTLPVGSTSKGGSFSDIFGKERIKDEWLGLIAESNPALEQLLQGLGTSGPKSNKYYLCFMAVRLIEMCRILKDTGSIYLHCDQTMGCHLRLVMDNLFGHKNHRGHIVWKRHTTVQKGSQHAPKNWGSTTDYILHYTKTDKFSLNSTRVLTPEETPTKFPLIDEKDKRYYTGIPLWCGESMGDRPNLCYTWRGFKNPHPSGWRLSKEQLEEEYQKGNIVITDKGTLQRRKYLKDYEGVPLGNIWIDIDSVKKPKYPTQKPTELLERIILASTNEGDVVLDPFCGCATTCIAAEKLKRQWIGIDVSDVAYDLVRQRLEEEASVTSHDPKHVAKTLSFGKVYLRTDIPEPTDTQYEPITISGKHKLYGQQEGFCKGCNIHFNFQNLTIDHIVPQSQGGGDSLENLQLLCNSCNSIKGDRPMEDLIVRLKELKRI